jgi:hypothetical protein
MQMRGVEYVVLHTGARLVMKFARKGQRYV